MIKNYFKFAVLPIHDFHESPYTVHVHTRVKSFSVQKPLHVEIEVKKLITRLRLYNTKED